MRNPGLHLVEIQGAQMFGDEIGSAKFLITQFRVLVNVTAPGNDPGFNRRGSISDVASMKCGQGQLKENSGQYRKPAYSCNFVHDCLRRNKVSEHSGRLNDVLVVKL
jgi:hypothetical protein